MATDRPRFRLKSADQRVDAMVQVGLKRQTRAWLDDYCIRNHIPVATYLRGLVEREEIRHGNGDGDT